MVMLADARLETVPHGFFSENGQIHVASAPGRLDVMGGIADYSGSLVLQLPLDRHTTAMVQPTRDSSITVVSMRGDVAEQLTTDVSALRSGPLSTPEGLASNFAGNETGRWGAYVLGVVHACLVRDARAPSAPAHGFRLFIQSDVPEGKGVSSSSAIEVACLAAVAACYRVDLTAEEIATHSQWAENHVAGAPCGIMDQMTSACGRRNHLLRLRCQPATVEGHVEIPPGYRFYGIDSGVRNAVTGADYSTVRTAAFMGYRIIAAVSDIPVERDGERVRVRDERWHGYLANIAPSQFTDLFESMLPERMLGADFLRKFGGITDPVTRVQPDRSYPVRQATAHPVRENARVERFATLLAELAHSLAAAVEMGRLMYASHASYGTCGLGSDGTDRLVEMVAEASSAHGLFGAKITGGGSGGTVAILGTEEAEASVRELASRYEVETGRKAEVFAGSGAGMAEIGVVLK
jgi:L-arabinokinase